MLKNLLKGLSPKKQESKREETQATQVNRSMLDRPTQAIGSNTVAAAKAPAGGSNVKTLAFRGVMVALIIGLGASEYLKMGEEGGNSTDETTVIAKQPKPAPNPLVPAAPPAEVPAPAVDAAVPTPETAVTETPIDAPKAPDVAITDTPVTAPEAAAPPTTTAEVVVPAPTAETLAATTPEAPKVEAPSAPIAATDAIAETAPALDLKPTESITEAPAPAAPEKVEPPKEVITEEKIAEVLKPLPKEEADAPPKVEPAPKVVATEKKDVGEDLKKDKLQLTQETPKTDDFLRLLNENTRSVSQEAEVKSKAEYTTPPNYERLGRGLVYNCVDKHYACLDRESYFRCKANREWSSENGKKPSCVELEVYQSEDDCSTIQQSRINKVVEVPQCIDRK